MCNKPFSKADAWRDVWSNADSHSYTLQRGNVKSVWILTGWDLFCWIWIYWTNHCRSGKSANQEGREIPPIVIIGILFLVFLIIDRQAKACLFFLSKSIGTKAIFFQPPYFLSKKLSDFFLWVWGVAKKDNSYKL